MFLLLLLLHCTKQNIHFVYTPLQAIDKEILAKKTLFFLLLLLQQNYERDVNNYLRWKVSNASEPKLVKSLLEFIENRTKFIKLLL